MSQSLVQLSRLEDKSERIDELWDDATKHYKTSYIAWTHYTEALM